jgi:hypothetical protein
MGIESNLNVLDVRIENDFFIFEYQYHSRLQNPCLLSLAVLGRRITLKHSMAR